MHLMQIQCFLRTSCRVWQALDLSYSPIYHEIGWHLILYYLGFFICKPKQLYASRIAEINCWRLTAVLLWNGRETQEPQTSPPEQFWRRGLGREQGRQPAVWLLTSCCRLLEPCVASCPHHNCKIDLKSLKQTSKKSTKPDLIKKRGLLCCGASHQGKKFKFRWEFLCVLLLVLWLLKITFPIKLLCHLCSVEIIHGKENQNQ